MQKSISTFIKLMTTTFALLIILSAIDVDAIEIMRLVLDNAESIGTKISTDNDVKIEGTGAVKISTL